MVRLVAMETYLLTCHQLPTTNQINTYHSKDTPWLLNPEGLHNLKDINHPLCLAALNGGRQGTVHARAAYSVTVYQKSIRAFTHLQKKSDYLVLVHKQLF